MSHLKKSIRNSCALLFAAAAISIAYVMPIRADDSTYLAQIVTNTNPIPTYINTILAFINSTLTNYINNIAGPALNNLTADDSSTAPHASISDFQGDFASLAQSIITADAAALTGSISAPASSSGNSTPKALFTPSLSTILFTDPDLGTAMTGTNSFDFSHLTSQSANTAGTDTTPQSYIANAAGLTLYHKVPQSWPRGSKVYTNAYRYYFNTVMSIESYNAYVLSEMYANMSNAGNPYGLFSTAQTTLITLASNSTSWFAKIAAESVGNVLRQILMFESQSFLILTEMLKTQKEMLYAQAMTNSAIIAINATNENTMVSRAQGSIPPGG